MRAWISRGVGVLSGLIVLGGVASSAPFARGADRADRPVTVEWIMTDFRPVQKDVDYDVIEPKLYGQCKIRPFLVKEGKGEVSRGYVVTGPEGLTLRRFVDSDGDGGIDQFSYFKSGLEVYRDQGAYRDAAKQNLKIEQSRWFNLGGTRWGIDTNADGKIDAWKLISPEEVSRIAVKALVLHDASLLTPLLVTKEDLKALGITGPLEAKLLANVADPAAKLHKIVSNSKMVHAKTAFTSSSATQGVIPADTYRTPGDLHVCENVMAFVDYGNPKEQGLVNLGELLRIGDVWKLTMLPQPFEGNVELAPGTIMYLATGSNSAEGQAVQSALSPKMQELLEKLKRLLESPPAATAAKAAFDKYYKEVESVHSELFNESKNDEDQIQWMRQLLDSIASGVQSGSYPAGVGRLRQRELEIAKASPKSPLVALAHYRLIQAQYALAVQETKGNAEGMQKAHAAWLEELEKFVEAYPKGEDAPDAALTLAISLEYDKVDRAKKWYKKIVDDYGAAPVAAKAAGALNRIDLEGKSLVLAGASLHGGGGLDIKQFRGKTVLVFFWDTTTRVATDDLLAIKPLYDEYHGKGFEFLGVNLDVANVALPWLTGKQIQKWPQIREPDGLDSAPAKAYGIVSLPTMFLVDANGVVTNRSASVAAVKTYLAETYDKK